MTTTTSTVRVSSSDIPRLRRGVKLIVGMDDQPMLFDSTSGAYHRLGKAAAFIVDQFDGARSLPTIIDQLPQEIDAAGRRRITRLVEYLRSKSLLEAASLPESSYRRTASASASMAATSHRRTSDGTSRSTRPGGVGTGCCRGSC